MSQKQINVLGWRYVLLLCDNGESIDNSLSRSEVKLSLCPGCTVFLQVERSKCSSHNCETSFVETVRISFIQAAYCHATCYVAPITGCTHGQQFTCQSYTSKPLLYASAIRYHFSFQTYFPWIKAENKCTTQFLVLWSNCEPKSIFQQIISGSITLALYKHRWQTFILASWQMKLGNDLWLKSEKANNLSIACNNMCTCFMHLTRLTDIYSLFVSHREACFTEKSNPTKGTEKEERGRKTRR